MKVVAIVQARMGSSRLPGKVLRPLQGKPLLEHQIRRIQRAKGINQIVLAIPDRRKDDAIVQWAKSAGVPVFRGSENDVLDRFYRAAKKHGASVVIRFTADCPLIDPEIIDRFLAHFKAHANELDYLSGAASYPTGMDMEVMHFSALEKAWKTAKKPSEREHVTVYLWQTGRFRIQRLEAPVDASSIRLTVDVEKDFQFITAIYQELFSRFQDQFGLREILALLDEKPELKLINGGELRNTGFIKSVRQERSRLMMRQTHSRTKSLALWKKAQELIPAHTVEGDTPAYLQRGQGSHVWDVDGNEYIDYSMGLGPVILGHSYPVTNAAIAQQLKKGITFTSIHPLEIETASLLKELVPCAERVRFGTNESDAVTGAVRLARARTGREKIAQCAYPGWYGRKEQPFGFTYNHIPSLEAVFQKNPGEIAAVLMEPVNSEPPLPGFLENVKSLARENGALLIFDEVASGFRYHLGGAHQLFKVDPDLVCFGSAIANGMPLSALAGRRDIMNTPEDGLYSSPMGGDCLSLAACAATLKEMKKKNVIGHLWEMGGRLQEGFNRLISDYSLTRTLTCAGLPPRTFAVFKESQGVPALSLKRLFQQLAARRGILFDGTHLISFSHSEKDIEATLGAYQEALEILGQALKDGTVSKQLIGNN